MGMGLYSPWAMRHQQLVGGDGKQEESGELEIVSCQCSRPSYSHKAASFPCWGAAQLLWDQLSGRGVRAMGCSEGEGRCSMEGAAGVYKLISGARPYLQQGLRGFMNRNNVGDLVPA